MPGDRTSATPSTDRPATDAPPPVGAAACLNCGAPLTGLFCASCGQRDIPPYPSLRELAFDAFSEFSGWDGRLAVTARALLFRPGSLTREFLEGRRARYLAPIRLYLMASIVYFLLAASAPNVTLASGETLGTGLRVSASGAKPTAGVALPSSPTRTDSGPLTPADRENALKSVEAAPALLRPFLRRAIDDPEAFKRDILVALPRMLFALLPVFAAIVALLYRGRKYPEHLYFALHLHAFIFLALAITELVKFTGHATPVIASGIGALVVIPFYATLAFRRVYGGSLVSTLAKEIAIGAIYGVTSLAAFAIVVLFVARFT